MKLQAPSYLQCTSLLSGVDSSPPDSINFLHVLLECGFFLNMTTRRIFIFFTGVVPDILGGWAVSRWMKQHKVSWSTRAARGVLENRKLSIPGKIWKKSWFLASKKSFLKLSYHGFGMSDCLLRLDRVKVKWTCKSVNPIRAGLTFRGARGILSALGLLTHRTNLPTVF